MIKHIAAAATLAGLSTPLAATIYPVASGTQLSTLQVPITTTPGCLNDAFSPATSGSAGSYVGISDTGGNSVPIASMAWEFDTQYFNQGAFRLDFDWRRVQGAAVNFCVIAYAADGTLSGDDYAATRALVNTFFSYNSSANADPNSGHVSMVVPNLNWGGLLGIQLSIQGYESTWLTISNMSIDVPEPAMLGLFGLGAIGLGLARRRKAA